MKLFPKRKENGAQHKSNTIAKGWAGWVTKRTEKFSRGTWIILLILFVLLTSAYCGYVMIGAFTKNRSILLTVTPIKKPAHANETGEAGTGVPEAEYQHIKKFGLFMDSLAHTPSGKMLYDSITSHRPGLMDSVRLVENYYEQLKQKQWKNK
ncbi:hypothetical protein [Parafilimonas sp.]|uniref:hypothetical protein n=1 Tax=Parafilimonas sp. TaxID=1969739 RepID=UPI0039E5C600